ncbi:hypothetical protein RCL_jg20339.t1 [Rhizophagus clarus]|uniref:Uncharacterized protein n=1 Tax=Rhizophagus clarus TaxID=94130 RepID=A0A8H3KW82_9GLOM|nr:hypothetical protein RCL_jg20339.t1 [Rhizophagus clarus]
MVNTKNVCKRKKIKLNTAFFYLYNQQTAQTLDNIFSSVKQGLDNNNSKELQNLLRLRNSHLINLNAPLEQILNENDVVPQNFLSTINHLRDMSDTDVDFLLMSYGLQNHGNTWENRHMLRNFIGVQYI